MIVYLWAYYAWVDTRVSITTRFEKGNMNLCKLRYFIILFLHEPIGEGTVSKEDFYAIRGSQHLP